MSINADDETSKLLRYGASENEKSLGTRNNVPPHKGYGARHTLAVLAFFGCFNTYAMRFNLSVAMVAMTNHTDIRSDSNLTTGSECPSMNQTKKAVNQAPEFDWDEATQGFILSSFFYGYVVTQIPGGWLAGRFGGKLLFGLSVLIPGILTIITPLVTKLGPAALIVTRVLEGLAGGLTFPALASMLGQWVPEMERTIIPMFIFAGCSLGNTVCLPIVGYLSTSESMGGWPSGFYIFGGLACVWYLFWQFLVHNTPVQHPTISKAERDYIQSTTGATTAVKMSSKDYIVPWRAILTSSAVWAVVVLNFTTSWGYFVTLTSLPTYMNKIQKYDIAQDGLLVALPDLVNLILGLITSWISDYLRQKGYLSTVAVRKLTTLIGLSAAAVVLPFITLAGCNNVVVVLLIVAGNGMLGVSVTGLSSNIYDIGHNYAGTLSGISNFFGNMPGIIAPYAVGLITNNQETMARWEIVFYISMALYLFGLVSFLIFGKGSEQPWNRVPKEMTHYTETKEQ
ncbi:sialin-like [Mizuhopecten yessoensis]|uniref:Sialin n=1 Tax=Mizuhopecten yessoensis TaxID=6573 RepID=A0A210Q905_MIZYE|nr:sialin-like [Mizuhopecten yessoensis]OWF45214.1 Sialin [Mizuhopecten yessoensis]